MSDHTVTRRQALAAAGAATAGLLAGAAMAAEPKPTWKMKLSTSTIQFSKLPIEQAVERIAKLGFDGIDIWSAHAGCPHLDDVQKRLGGEGLKKLLAQHKIDLFAFSVYRGGYAKYAKLLGEAGGGVAVRGSAGRVKPAELTAAMKKFLDKMKPDLELAEKHNGRIAIENHGGALLTSLDSFKAFVDLNQNPRLGIALAPYHIQGQKESVPDAIRIAGKQLLFFYAWQRAGGVQQLPGHGPTDFTPWIAALAETGYAGHVNAFMHHEPAPDVMAAALAKSKTYLETCAKAVTG